MRAGAWLRGSALFPGGGVGVSPQVSAFLSGGQGLLRAWRHVCTCEHGQVLKVQGQHTWVPTSRYSGLGPQPPLITPPSATRPADLLALGSGYGASMLRRLGVR